MKALLIPFIVGLLFMSGGLYLGMQLIPKPTLPPPVVAAPTETKPSVDEGLAAIAVKKTSDSLIDLGHRLQGKEQELDIREEKIKAKEAELQAEKEALNRSHQKLTDLFLQFQGRLQGVETNQNDQLQRQVALYAGMSSDQAIDLLRAKDDPSLIRLFSLMDTKPLSKLIAQWKVKYPDDTDRLLQAMDGMGRVVPADKLAQLESAGSDAGSVPSNNSLGSSSTTNPTSDVPSPVAMGASPVEEAPPANTTDTNSTASSSSPPSSSTPAVPDQSAVPSTNSSPTN